MSILVTVATVQTASADGTDITVGANGNPICFASVKNTTGKKIVVGQQVVIHYREAALTSSEPACITSILSQPIYEPVDHAKVAVDSVIVIDDLQ